MRLPTASLDIAVRTQAQSLSYVVTYVKRDLAAAALTTDSSPWCVTSSVRTFQISFVPRKLGRTGSTVGSLSQLTMQFLGHCSPKKCLLGSSSSPRTLSVQFPDSLELNQKTSGGFAMPKQLRFTFCDRWTIVRVPRMTSHVALPPKTYNDGVKSQPSHPDLNQGLFQIENTFSRNDPNPSHFDWICSSTGRRAIVGRYCGAILGRARRGDLQKAMRKLSWGVR